MQKLILSLFSISLIVVIGCGRKSSNSAHESPGLQGAPIHSEGDRLARSYNVYCEAEAHQGLCSSTALFVRKEGDVELSTCTAFIAGELDGKTIMATNNHCVSEMRDTELCRSNIAFAFPESNGFSAETAICERVITSAQKVSVTEPDYAFILLNRKINRPHHNLSGQGVKDSEILTVVHADTDSIRKVSVIRSTQCEAVMNSIFNSNYSTELSRSIALYGCQLRPGNSGSPIVNSSGQTVAIVQAGAGDRNLIDLKMILDPTFREYFKNLDLTLVSIATNLSCIDAPEIGISPTVPESCKPENDEKSKEKIDPKIQVAMAQIDREVRAWMNQGTHITLPAFKIKKNEVVKTTMELNSTPLCFMPPTKENNWVEKYKRTFWFGYQNEAEEIIIYKDWRVLISFNKRGQSQVDVSTYQKHLVLKFNPDLLVEKGSTRVEIRDLSAPMNGLQEAIQSNMITKKLFGDLLDTTTVLSFCTPEQIQNF